jgi:hypothetical protein
LRVCVRLLLVGLTPLLLAACQPASSATPTPSPDLQQEIRGFVVGRDDHVHELTIRLDGGSKTAVLFDTPAWKACSRGEHYPECL